MFVYVLLPILLPSLNRVTNTNISHILLAHSSPLLPHTVSASPSSISIYCARHFSRSYGCLLQQFRAQKKKINKYKKKNAWDSTTFNVSIKKKIEREFSTNYCATIEEEKKNPPIEIDEYTHRWYLYIYNQLSRHSFRIPEWDESNWIILFG